MDNQADSSERSFEPTEQKLQDSRKKGEIARSTELLVAGSYLGFLVALIFASYNTLSGLTDTLSVLIGQSAQLSQLFFDGAALGPSMGLLKSTLAAIAPIFAFPAFVVLALLFATRGIVFASNKITPKISKLSPIANAKHKYGKTGLFQFTISFVKLAVYSVCLIIFIELRLEDMVAALHASPHYIVSLLFDICLDFFIVVVAVSVVIGAIDALWQHFEHLRKNRMTRREIMDETKNSEGDPYMKQERRQRGHSLANMNVAAEVAKADVIIVNPTHYAVALKWERRPGTAPVCLAKGVDEMARTIREVATQHAVPIHSDPPTARALHATTHVGQEIAPKHYKAVAAAIRFAENMRSKAGKRGF